MRTSQDVSIMGADPAHFNDMVIAVEEIYDKFAAYFPEESLKRTEGQTVDGEFVLYFGTRYHSHHKAAKGESSLKLSRVVDPFGILEKAVGTRGKHLADNKVSFFARTDMGDGTKAKYVPSRHYDRQYSDYIVGGSPYIPVASVQVTPCRSKSHSERSLRLTRHPPVW